jgi:hypothetical protein
VIKNAKIAGIGVNPADYHGAKKQRGAKDYVISSSSLREFAICPRRWICGYEQPDSESKKWGNLLDTLLLTPGQFSSRYAVKPETYTNEKGDVKPWNGNANVCKEWLAQHQDREIVSVIEIENCDSAIARIKEDEIIAAFLDASDTQIHVTGEWHDKSGTIIPIQCLIDLVPKNDTEFAKCLADLKTTRNAALMPWQRWCFQAGYYIQAAFNHALYCAAKPDEDRNTFCFILQENYPPWQPGKRILAQDFMELGTAEFTRLLGNYCQCLNSGKWPSYDDNDESIQGWSIVAPEPWMADHAAFAPKFDFEQQGQITTDDDEITP